MNNVTKELVSVIKDYKEYKKAAEQAAIQIYGGSLPELLNAIFTGVVLTSEKSMKAAMKEASVMLAKAREDFDWDNPEYLEVPEEKGKKVVA